MKDSYFSDEDSVAVTATIDIPSTRRDYSLMHQWMPGDDEPDGTAAKNNKLMKNYRRDINKVYGKEDSDYRIVLIDTLRPINDQLEKVRGKAKKQK